MGSLGVNERQHSKSASLSIVVGPEDEGRVLNADHKDQGPKDQTEDAQHGVGIDKVGMEILETLPQGIEWTRPYIAKHHTQSAEGE
jgi:hypothetical protein